jgi:hypothetical protein
MYSYASYSPLPTLNQEKTAIALENAASISLVPDAIASLSVAVAIAWIAPERVSVLLCRAFRSERTRLPTPAESTWGFYTISLVHTTFEKKRRGYLSNNRIQRSDDIRLQAQKSIGDAGAVSGRQGRGGLCVGGGLVDVAFQLLLDGLGG